MGESTDRGRFGVAPPSALHAFPEFFAALAGRRASLYLDYDGTLTAIVERPEDALLPTATRTRLEQVAAVCPTAVVSGRDLDDVRSMVALDGLVYSGCHGFDIAGPGLRRQIGEDALPLLDLAWTDLQARLAGIPGVAFERKRFGLTVHTRRMDAADKPAVTEAVAAAVRPGLRQTTGKEVLELRPDLPWDKGRAILALLGLPDRAGTTPIFIGDDDTDEDGFRAIAGIGIGIRVMDAPVATGAGWSLAGPGEVSQFLERFATALGHR